jgi:hypothetical protein
VEESFALVRRQEGEHVCLCRVRKSQFAEDLALLLRRPLEPEEELPYHHVKRLAHVEEEDGARGLGRPAEPRKSRALKRAAGGAATPDAAALFVRESSRNDVARRGRDGGRKDLGRVVGDEESPILVGVPRVAFLEKFG